MVILIIPEISAQDSDQLQTPTHLDEEDEPVLTESDLIILFSASIAIVLGIILYTARDTILRRKNRYDVGSFESKKDRDFEKYHSDWSSYDDPDSKKDAKEEEFSKARQNSNLPDYYAVLGIPKNSTHDQIKSKFRQLAKELHPDKNKNSDTAEKMAEVNKAYEVLSDEEQRKKYDKYFAPF